MSDGPDNRLLELKAQFDTSFARPAQLERPQTEGLLLARLGDALVGLRVRGIASVERDRTSVPLPGVQAPFRGICAIRGQIVAVYAMEAFIGATPGAGRWLAVSRAAPDVALSFDAVDAYRVVQVNAFHPAEDATRPHVRHVIRLDDALLPVLDLDSVLERIRNRTTPETA